VWRRGSTLTARVPPGPLGVELDARPAPGALRDASLLAQARGAGFAPLPGTRREVEAIARLFGKADTLLGKDASQQKLEDLAGKLKGYAYLHLATHGLADPDLPLRSYLALCDRTCPTRWGAC
jgi:CHAT domain-containing protein